MPGDIAASKGATLYGTVIMTVHRSIEEEVHCWTTASLLATHHVQFTLKPFLFPPTRKMAMPHRPNKMVLTAENLNSCLILNFCFEGQKLKSCLCTLNLCKTRCVLQDDRTLYGNTENCLRKIKEWKTTDVRMEEQMRVMKAHRFIKFAGSSWIYESWVNSNLDAKPLKWQRPIEYFIQ